MAAHARKDRAARVMAALAWILPCVTGAAWAGTMAYGPHGMAVAAGLMFGASLLAMPVLAALALRGTRRDWTRAVARVALGVFVLLAVAWLLLTAFWPST